MPVPEHGSTASYPISVSREAPRVSCSPRPMCSRTIARIAHQIIEKTALDSPGRAAARRAYRNPDPRHHPRGAARRPDRRVLRCAPCPRVPRHHPLPRRSAGQAAPPARTHLGADGGVDNTLVVLVDDVLFSGRTVRSALDALRDLGRPGRRAARRTGRPRSPRTSVACRLRRKERSRRRAARTSRCCSPNTTAATP